MTAVVQWEKEALADKEAIYVYLCQEAGVEVAGSVDEKLDAMATLLEGTPLAGVQAGKLPRQRKLIAPRLPFIMVYTVNANIVRIMRVLHTARNIVSRYRRH
ncbi:type II toxin-antitoxin system RelE/ParE family toxin [Acerihabitans sp. TG2]|uniref:type II toxin-antitoxin system RelE/ParE family toxin n=1 Tax=Acerihabitans sp. TG2 TaxID=3096008 RepID=UPI002B224E6D|nr:type II toxin-antitoxin system RelE/ParE family toxin [Acerihabitans sp. TG2]MEA9393573.1 type II toxin-antitoxin system RelE/ParE family toxin [Acerihabitans sp. TG2]